MLEREKLSRNAVKIVKTDLLSSQVKDGFLDFLHGSA